MPVDADGNEVIAEKPDTTGMDELVDEGFVKMQAAEIGDMVEFFLPDTSDNNKKGETPIEKKEEPLKTDEPEKTDEPQKIEEPVIPVEPKADPLVDMQKGYEETINAMRLEMERLSGLLSSGGKQQLFPQQPEVPKVEAPKVIEKAPSDISSVFGKLLERNEFLTKEQMDEVIDHPEHINTAIANSRKEMLEGIMEVLPVIINGTVSRELIMHKATTSFYEGNTDLAPFAKSVQIVFQEVENANRDKPYEEIFKLTAEESRKRLGLKTPILTSEKKGQPLTTDNSKPAFAGTKQGTTTPIAKGNKGAIFDENARDLFD